MSIKLHFLHSHLDKVLENLRHVGDEQGERFPLDIKTVKKCHQDGWDRYIMADYCWNLQKDYIAVCHRRKSSQRKCLPL